MVKNINGEIYSDVMGRADGRLMNGQPRGNERITNIVIHHNAGTNNEAALNTWLVGSPAGTSAHYQITPDEIIGAVGENYIAYHAGNWNMNVHSIGLEHLNNSGAPNWTIAEDTYKNSARLIADICKRYGLPIDRNTIKKHSEVSDLGTACPGGIDIDKLVAMAKQVANGGNVTPPKPTPPKPNPKPNPAKPTGRKRMNYRVDDLKQVNGIWQIYCAHLHKVDFNWTENGIPVSVVDKVSPATGEKTKDQVLKVGDYFNFQIPSVGVVQEQTPYKGYTLSHVQLPTEFIWLFVENKDKLLYS